MKHYLQTLMVVVLLGLAASCFAQVQLTINGPPEVLAGNAALFSVSGTNTPGVEWRILPKEAAPYFTSWANFKSLDANNRPLVDHRAFFACTIPGTYHIIAAAADNNGGVALVVHTFVNKGSKPEPGPDPQPDPDPDPNPPPPPGKRFVLVVQEVETPSPARAQTIVGLRRYVNQKDHAWRILDQHTVDTKDKTPAWMVPYIDQATKAGLKVPLLFVGVCDADGNVSQIQASALPATAEAAIQFVQRHGG